MGLIRSQDDVQPGSGHFPDLEAGVDCFLCHDPVGGPTNAGFPLIYWAGASRIYFHAACAADFTFRVGQDVQRLKHEGNLHLAFVPD